MMETLLLQVFQEAFVINSLLNKIKEIHN
jgi:hypothetical protein